jgi:hypothetical protein
MEKKERLEKMEARIARIEKARIERYRIEHERIEKARIENEIIEKAKIETARIENEIIEKAKIETERIKNEIIENERLEKKRIKNKIIEKEKSQREFKIKKGIIKPKIEELKLKIELVPENSKLISLSSCRVCTEQEWKDLSQKNRDDAGCKCEICGAEGKYFSDSYKQNLCYGLECHEEWFYDDEMHIQYLKRLITLCELCHRVKHIRKAEFDAKNGTLDMKTVIEHFIKVNNCTQKTYEEHKNEAVRDFNWRSIFDWKIDFGEYAVSLPSVRAFMEAHGFKNMTA